MKNFLLLMLGFAGFGSVSAETLANNIAKTSITIENSWPEVTDSNAILLAFSLIAKGRAHPVEAFRLESDCPAMDFGGLPPHHSHTTGREPANASR